MKNNNTQIRAVGYCRTSGEKQRDNTSIPRQKAEIERFVSSNNWTLFGHYVDESKSGSSMDGRDDASIGLSILISFEIESQHKHR